MHKQNTLRIWELSALVGLCLCLLAEHGLLGD